MFSQFDDGEIAAPDGPFDVVETYSDWVGFVAGSTALAATGTTTATSSTDSSFLHLHHLRSFIEIRVDQAAGMAGGLSAYTLAVCIIRTMSLLQSVARAAAAAV